MFFKDCSSGARLSQEEFDRGSKVCSSLLNHKSPVAWAELFDSLAFFTLFKNYLQVCRLDEVWKLVCY